MYNFIDVTEASEGVVLPSEAMKINGEYIENLISGYRTLHVQGREALSPDVVSYTTGVRDGSRLKSKRFPERIITITYQLKAATDEEFREAYNKLGGILNVENAELIFNDEQDKFFIGTPCIIDAVKPGVNAVVASFEILCTDPFKYSVYEYEVEPGLNEASVLVDYAGTYKAYPILEADFYKEEESSEDGETVTALTGSGDCGFVAFFTEDEKIVQIGDPDEVDGEETFAKSQTLMNATFDKSTSWGSAAKSQWGSNSGITSSNAVVQTGYLEMGEASPSTSYSATTGRDKSANFRDIASTSSDNPQAYYNVSVSTSDRKANSVKVNIILGARLKHSDSWMGNGKFIRAKIELGGVTKYIIIKDADVRWEGKTYRYASASFTVSGLSTSQTSISALYFTVESMGGTGTAGAVSRRNLGAVPIPTYTVLSTDTAATHYLAPSDFGSGSDWHGPSITRVIPADASGEVGATNFALTYSQKMSIGSGSGATSQLGAFQVLLVSGSGSSRKIVAGVNVYKGSNGKSAKLRFYLNGSVAETMDIDLSYNNKYFRSGNSSTITKSGKTVNFNICGVKKTYRDDDIADLVVKEVTFTFTKFGTKTPLAYNGLYWAKFVKNNCDTWKDIPNKFSTGDVVEADCRNGEIYLNGVLTPALGALGNDWEDFVLTPGFNQIGVAYSEWVDADYAPKFKVRYREVFL